MIAMRDGLIHLQTQDTSYILSTRRAGLVETVFYGARIHVDDPAPLLVKADAGFGSDVLRPEGQPALSSLLLELAPQGRGDYRRGALLAEMPHGGQTSDFCFATARELSAPAPSGGMPQAKGGNGTVALSFSEPSGLEVELFYTVFEEANVITKKMRVTNRGSAPARLLRALSTQIDLPRADLELHTFTGAWAREFTPTVQQAATGLRLFGSGMGPSSARCNPFFYLAEPHATEAAGEVYGFNLVYSGAHEGSVETDPFGHTRVMQGVWSDGFSWPLAPGESFTTPEAVLTFSDEGLTGMSHNMHRFVKSHILPQRWQNAPRPVLVNNWEGTYFNFSEGKLLGMAKVAAGLGVETFVLDDGWFGRRDSDKRGLGDYDVNRKKLPSGLRGLATKLRALGLDFGLWFEPEMVSRDSRLFEQHPDWIIRTPGYEPCTGRQQYVLDLCRAEVRDYIIDTMGAVLDSADIRYVKWDMNRNISDAFSLALADQGGFLHRYTLGLYQLFDGICATRPGILFEGCASGGNRFDLGVLCYMPQVWISDDSDAHERQRIQTNVSYGYPPCVMGCHVSAVPNHQTLRCTPLETRFATAAFGLLGYELDMRTLTAQEKADVRSQIAFYKANRELLQYGDFYRLQTPVPGGGCRWMAVAPDKSAAVVGDFMGLLVPNSNGGPMRLAGLEPRARYEIAVRRQKMDITAFGGLVNFISPVHLNPDGLLVKTAAKLYRLDTEQESYIAFGDALCKAGLVRQQEFTLSGFSEQMRFVNDFGCRLYTVRRLTANAAPKK